jgi:hypothetical protein
MEGKSGDAGVEKTEEEKRPHELVFPTDSLEHSQIN